MRRLTSDRRGGGERGGEVHEGVNPREGMDRDGGEDVGGDGATRPCASHGAWMERCSGETDPGGEEEAWILASKDVR